MLAERIGRIELSPTFKINAKAKRLQADGIDVLDFSVGEPDFPTPAAAKIAGIDAIAHDVTRYTANEGTLPLRRAIVGKLKDDNGLEYGEGEILVSPGAKASIFCAAMALFGPDDEVLIPAPYWVSYPEQVRLAGATPVVVTAKESREFKLTPDDLKEAIGPKTKGLILNYPCNPTGACYDRDELAALARVAGAAGLSIIADEIYEKLIYDGKGFTSIAAVSREAKERTVVVNGMSKAFAMTGWRLGYAAGPRDVIEAMGRVQSHSTSHPAAMAQAAGEVALRWAGDDVRTMTAEFERRRDAIVAGLAKLPGFSCVRPSGAFYVFPNVSALFGRSIGGRTVRSGQDVAEALLDTARVAVVPGEAFGSRDHVRLSFSCALARIEDGLARIAQAIA
ncbi:MAG TPA: pyridoxal phosphate-dependent aminotransferase [Candidatus Polarisedimenticolaceae bacterium]|nr:pyridoxal phosphate-dependent aminotransferase [Candidatus Polarisedimenticolaceae bacterium]